MARCIAIEDYLHCKIVWRTTVDVGNILFYIFSCLPFLPVVVQLILCLTQSDRREYQVHQSEGLQEESAFSSGHYQLGSITVYSTRVFCLVRLWAL